MKPDETLRLGCCAGPHNGKVAYWGRIWLFDAISDHAEHGGRMTFWTCPRGCNAIVDWDHSGKTSVATCRRCGARSAASQA